MKRFSDLHRALPWVSQKVLTAQLRELIPALNGLHAWGSRVQAEA